MTISSTSSNARAAERLLKRLEVAMQGSSKSVQRSGLSNYALHFLRSWPAARIDLDVEAVCRELRNQAWFSKLPSIILRNDGAFKNLLRYLVTEKLNTTAVSIHAAGDDVEEFYVVISGALEIRDSNQKIIQLLTPGEVAGENFLDEGAVWRYDVCVEENGAEVLVLNRDEFERIIKPYLDRALEEITEFLGQTEAFGKVDYHTRMAIANCLTWKSFPSNTEIFKQGEIAHDFFIILNGYCRVLKEVTVPARVLTTLRAPYFPDNLFNHSASGDNTVGRKRPVIADLGNPEKGATTLGAGSWLCPSFREPAPQRYRVVSVRRRQSVSIQPSSTSALQLNDGGSADFSFRSFSARQRPASAHPSLENPLFRSSKLKLDLSGFGQASSKKFTLSGSRQTSSRTLDSSSFKIRKFANSRKAVPGMENSFLQKESVSKKNVLSSPRATDRGIDAGKPILKRMPTNFSLYESTRRSESSSESSIMRRNRHKMGGKRATFKDIEYSFADDELSGSKRVILEVQDLWKGQHFGEHSLIMRTTRMYSVATMCVVELLVLNKVDFLKLGLNRMELIHHIPMEINDVDFDETLQSSVHRDLAWTNYKNDSMADIVYGSTFAKDPLASAAAGTVLLSAKSTHTSLQSENR